MDFFNALFKYLLTINMHFIKHLGNNEMVYCPQFKFIAILSQSDPVSSEIGGVLSLSFINPVEQKWGDFAPD